jgi:hypothetical protein
LLIGIGAIIPLATDHAEAGSRKSKRYKKKRGWKGVKKYSKRWWQLYRAQERRKRQRAESRRGLRLRQLRLAKARENQETASRVAAAKPGTVETQPVSYLPTGDAAPKGWTRSQVSGSEIQFRVDNGNGAEAGTAAISVVGPATGETYKSGRHNYLGGVPTTALRREVINRMIRENGWVVNDYQKEIGGKSVYVVVAQSQGRGGVQSRMFYFTETDGRIYSVATNSRTDAAERIAEESEKVIYSLQGGPRRVQQALNK